MSNERAAAINPEGFPITLETFNELLDKAKAVGPETPTGGLYMDAAKAVLACATRSHCTQPDAGTSGPNAIQRFVAEIRQNSWSFGALLLTNTLVLGALVDKITGPAATKEVRGVVIAGAVFGLLITILWALLYGASTKMHDHALWRVKAEDQSEPPPQLFPRRRHVLYSLIGLFFLVYLILLVVVLSGVLVSAGPAAAG